jgi:hypothetical protein
MLGVTEPVSLNPGCTTFVSVKPPTPPPHIVPAVVLGKDTEVKKPTPSVPGRVTVVAGQEVSDGFIDGRLLGEAEGLKDGMSEGLVDGMTEGTSDG